MNNLTYHFPTCYIIRVKAYRELNLVRALDEDIRVFSFYSCLLHWTRVVSGNVSDPGNLCLLLESWHDILFKTTTVHC